MIEVARRYKFTATHHVPELAAPWNEPHEHLYTVEVVAAGELDDRGIVIDTDAIDWIWQRLAEQFVERDLNVTIGDTTVEALAVHLLAQFAVLDPVVRVSVREDDERWGSAAK